MRKALTLLTFIALLSAGCLGAADLDAQSTSQGDAPAAELEPIGTPTEQDHDHTDVTQHTNSANVDLVAWKPFIREELGQTGFAGLRICDDWAILANDGPEGGFLILDITEPRDPELVGRYVTTWSATQEALPMPGCDYVLLNGQDLPNATEASGHPEEGTGTGIQIVDISDKSNPEMVSWIPVRLYGSHNIHVQEIDGEPYVFYTGQPLRLGVFDQAYTTATGNVITINKWVEEPTPQLVPVSEWRYLPAHTGTSDGGSFPHDLRLAEHPVTGQMLMYVAHWDGGAVTVDVSNPATPTTLDGHSDPAPSQYRSTHYFRPDATMRDGKHIAWSGPELGITEGEPGLVRAYDVTDPASIEQVGTWSLPSEVENTQPYLFSPHNFDFQGDIMALGHYHAGVWFLDASDPTNATAVAYYEPHTNETDPYTGEVWRKTPNFPEAYLPNVFGVRWVQEDDGSPLLYVSERGTGLYILDLATPLHDKLDGSAMMDLRETEG